MTDTELKAAIEQVLKELSDAAWSMGLQNASLEELGSDRQNRMTVRKATTAIQSLVASERQAAVENDPH